MTTSKHDPSFSDEEQKKFRRRQQKIRDAYRERLQKEEAVALSQFPDKIFVHYRNGERYIFVDPCWIQVDGRWGRAVLYRKEGGMDLYVRPLKEFFEKFTQAK